MSYFSKGGGSTRPFGRNEFLRSTNPKPQTESYTFAHDTLPFDKDGETVTEDKILQPGTVLAKITAAGPNAGKVGVFDTTATDGRQTPANIVGLNLTFLPWQLKERDVEVSAVVTCTAVQAWCFQYTAGVRAVLTNAVADAMRGGKRLEIKFA